MSIKELKAGSVVTLAKLTKNEHKTQPPPRYSEVSLVKKLSDLGIGRPSTFASIVSVIQERGYVTKIKGQQLAPTFLGFAVASLLSEKFPAFTSYDYTSQMEEALEEVEEGKISREKFLSNFWSGPKGFEQLIKDLNENIDWDEIRKLATLDLNNGYSVVYNKFGAFLQDNNGTPNEKGYLPSVKLDDDAMAEDYTDVEVCKTLFEKSANRVDARELGTLTSGNYKGWLVTARDGKYGAFLQGTDPAGKEKPVNHPLPEGKELAKVTLEEVADLFEEVKLPRNLSEQYFVGVGKKGAYIGFKKTAKSRKAEFKSLPEDLDPRKVTLDEVKKVWSES